MITTTPYGTLGERPVFTHALTNANGLKIELIDYGARLTRLIVPGRTGEPADIVLGFDDLAAYVATDTYFGATCGRYGNRIRDGRLELGGRSFQLAANEGRHHLHGGVDGFDKRVWDAHPDHDANAVSFTLLSNAGNEGYPGTLLVKATYRLTDDDRLSIAMSGTTDDATVLNMVHHSYFNAAGHGAGDVRDQVLTVHADFYTPVDAELLATGEIRAVAGTAFDFRREKRIGEDLDAGAAAGARGGGYDHNWVLRGAGPGLRPVATLLDPASGRGFTLSGSEPGVQIYTGGYLDESVVGKGDTPYRIHAGLTFETQKFPGSPEFAHFPTARLDPGAVYDHRMAFQFFTR